MRENSIRGGPFTTNEDLVMKMLTEDEIGSLTKELELLVSTSHATKTLRARLAKTLRSFGIHKKQYFLYSISETSYEEKAPKKNLRTVSVRIYTEPDSVDFHVSVEPKIK